VSNSSDHTDPQRRHELVEARLATFVPPGDLRQRILTLDFSELVEHTAQFDPRCHIGNPKTGIRRGQFDMLATVYLYLRDEILPGLEYSIAETEIVED